MAISDFWASSFSLQQAEAMPGLSVKRGGDTERLRQRHAHQGTTATTTSTTSTSTTATSTTTTTTTITRVSRPTENASNNNDNSSGKARQRTMLRQLYVQQQEEQQRNQVVNAAFSSLIRSYIKTLLILCLLGTALLCFWAPSVVSKWTQSTYVWWQDTIWNPRLLPPPPSRTLITIYPMHIHVRRDLPGFFQAYALATLHNVLARQAVQHAAGLRRSIMRQNQNKNVYQQSMALVPWDVLDFTTQLRSVDSMNRFCSAATGSSTGSGGSGDGGGVASYGQAFYDLSAQQQQQSQQQNQDADRSTSSRILFEQSEANAKRQDLMIWCLLASGHHDGYIQFHVQEIHASLSRGISGIAISKKTRRPPHSKDDNLDEKDEDHSDSSIHESIDSSSILFLPQHDSVKLSLAAQQRQMLGPSTLVPRKTLAWIVEHVHLPLAEYRRGLEAFLHQVISEEIREATVAEKQQQAAARTNSSPDGNSSIGTRDANQLNPSSSSPPKWILWTAACSETERQSFEQQYRLMATTCITDTKPTLTTTRSNDSNSSTMAQNGNDNPQDCCSFYDPKLPPMIQRRDDD